MTWRTKALGKHIELKSRKTKINRFSPFNQRIIPIWQVAWYDLQDLKQKFSTCSILNLAGLNLPFKRRNSWKTSDVYGLNNKLTFQHPRISSSDGILSENLNIFQVKTWTKKWRISRHFWLTQTDMFLFSEWTGRVLGRVL